MAQDRFLLGRTRNKTHYWQDRTGPGMPRENSPGIPRKIPRGFPEKFPGEFQGIRETKLEENSVQIPTLESF